MITNVLHTKCFADPFPRKVLAVVNECTALHQILKFHHFPSEEFFSKCSEWCNGAFPEYFLTRKLGEISVLNAAQELIFSKFCESTDSNCTREGASQFLSLLFSRVVERTLSTSRLLLLKHVIAINLVM